MTEFKIGDELWWFEGPEQSVLLDPNDLEINNDIILSICDTHYWLSDKNTGLIKSSNFYFKCKQHAIVSMIKRLEELKNK